MRPLKVISGGQTGVDRAALDAAMERGIPVGGWCPQGRRAEDGFVPRRYPLEETPSSDYIQRTAWNVRDSDATLVLTLGALEGGSLRTTEIAKKLGKPFLVVELDLYAAPDTVADFIAEKRAAILNIAGPRESGRPGIHQRAYHCLVRAFARDERSAGHILR